MSRIGVEPINIPSGVEVKLEGAMVKVKGPKGELEQEMPGEIIIEKTGDQLIIKRPTEGKKHRSLHGLTRSLLNNMVQGVSEGFSKTLEIEGVGYRATQQGDKINLAVGFSHPVVIEPEGNITLEAPTNNRIVVKGIDKQQVGNFAARIRDILPPEPYKGKGIKYQGERIRKKVGKAGK